MVITERKRIRKKENRQTLFPQSKNKADVLIHVKKSWIVMVEVTQDPAEVCCLGHHELYHRHHMGVDRTLFLVYKVNVDQTPLGRLSKRLLEIAIGTTQSILPLVYMNWEKFRLKSIGRGWLLLGNDVFVCKLWAWVNSYLEGNPK